MSVALIYDPRYHTFESWASLMCELYASNQLQVPIFDIEWQSWAAGPKAIDVFANEAIPEPYQFDDWQEWAMAVVGAVNPRTN